jgi:NDP-sugar pyrophosphorylase family protein
MKVVILAGGFGTRISEESHLIPKPMIEIGDKPILWHIMKYYSSFGHNEFIICAGYKQYVIKEFFSDYYLHTSDVTFEFAEADGSKKEVTPLEVVKELLGMLPDAVVFSEIIKKEKTAAPENAEVERGKKIAATLKSM